MAIVALALAGDRFTIGNLRGFGVDINFITIFKFTEHDAQMKIAHTIDYQFFGLGVMRDRKAGVLGCQLIKRYADLSFIAAGCRFQSQSEHRFGQGTHLKLAGELTIVDEVTDF